MLCRSPEKLKPVFILSVLVIITMWTGGCATSPYLQEQGRKLAPHDAVPDEFYAFFYYNSRNGSVDALDSVIEKTASLYGLPDFFIRRTEQIRAVSAEGSLKYFIMNGSYPDSFIKDRLRKSKEWDEGRYRKISYFYSTLNRSVIIPVINNCIIAGFRDKEIQSEQQAGALIKDAEEIINIVYEGSGKNTDIDPQTSMLLNMRKIDNSFDFLVPDKYNRKNIDEIIFSLSRKDPDLDPHPGILTLQGEFVFSTAKEAVLFSTVFKIFFADWLRKEGIGSFALLIKNNSIVVEGNKLYIRNIELADEKADSVIEQIIGNTGF